VGLDLNRLNAMKETLMGYRDMIERERADALEAQFREFTGRMGIDPDIEGLRSQFIRMMEIVSNDDLPAKDRIASAIESDFLYSTLSARSGATHREMRALTKELATFVGKAARGADDEQQFVQNLISGALRQLADQVERPARGEPGSEHTPIDFWTDAIRIGLEAIVKT
jgi:hypothetical protein